MRPQLPLRTPRSRMAAMGAIASLALVAGAPHPAPAQSGPVPAISVADPTLVYGQTAVVRGSLPAQEAGRSVSLEYAVPGGAWTTVRTGTVGADGRYALTARLSRSGVLRVTAASGTAQASSAGAEAPRSAEQRVTVAAVASAHGRTLDVAVRTPATVAGVLRPGRAGRIVRLERLVGRTWRPLALARTTLSGYYRLTHRPLGTGSAIVRVAFAGDTGNGAASLPLGRLTAYRPSLASYYTLYGGALACGGRLGYHSLVVAHKTLPCGTRVTVRYRGRSVLAVVRDRGPYAGGREFDLAGAVARRVGFSGVGTILVSH